MGWKITRWVQCRNGRRESTASTPGTHGTAWIEEVKGKGSLNWYRMVKEVAGLEQYTRSSDGHEELRLWYQLRTGSAGLLEDKKQCRMCTDDRHVLCDSGQVEDVKHFLVRCEEFSWERQKLLERIGQMEGSQEWLEEYWRVEEEEKMALLLGRSIEGGA